MLKAGDIFCLTETQYKTDSAKLNSNVTKYINMREVNDKKGGGLMVLHLIGCGIDLSRTSTKSNDLLELRGKIKDIHIRILLVYMSVESRLEDKQRNKSIQKEIIEKIQECQRLENEAVILLGDFNGHIGYLGNQRLDNNGKFILDLMTEQNMILLNDDSRCIGTYTWSRDKQKSVIDYILVNQSMYNIYKWMNIDENQELVDISDHNLITLNFQVAQISQNFTRHGLWEYKEYYKTDSESLSHYTKSLERKVAEKTFNITELNNIIKQTADETLKHTYRRRTIQQQCVVQESPWMNDDIRLQIKKRKEYNRARRHTTDPDERERLTENYLRQKKKVQQLVREEMYKYEIKITN